MKQINYDFQGWPTYIMTLKEILMELGFTENEGKLSIDSNNEILNAYPRLLTDDGMGYGVDEEYITEVGNYIYEIDLDSLKVMEDDKHFPIEYKKETTKEKVFNLFRDKTTNDNYINYLNKTLNDGKENN